VRPEKRQAVRSREGGNSVVSSFACQMLMLRIRNHIVAVKTRSWWFNMCYLGFMNERVVS
jgi:hypothetical protein